MNGIVERADREQPLAVDGMRQAERRQQQEQVHLGDAELDVLAVRRAVPALGRGDLLAAEQVGHLVAGEQAAAVHPGAEIGRDGDVGRGGDDAARRAPSSPRAISCRIWPKPCCVDIAGDAGTASRAGTGILAARWRRAPPCANGTRGEEGAQLVGGDTAGPRTGPIRGPRARSCACAQASICAGVIRPAWLSLWPASGRPTPLIV